MTLVEQLNHVYYEYETWHRDRETLAGITNYHQAMLDKGNMIVCFDGSDLVGYIEYWLINDHQLGRISRNEKFVAPFEDTTHGNISYLANLWIHPDFRRGWVAKYLRMRYMDKSKNCDYICGHHEGEFHFHRVKKERHYGKL